MRGGGATVVATLAATLGVSACFLGYNSSWGETKRGQQRLAEAGAAANIASDEPAPPAAAKRVWRVRFRPDGQYLAQTIDAPKQLAALLDDANRVLAPALALRLELDRIEPWSTDTDDNLTAALARLRTEDQGEQVDLVIGLVGALPHQTESLHEVGMAPMLGKHLVVRAASRAGERDAIDRAFDQLSDEDRTRLLARRKSHRALAVLLHEIGHCLGALHENDRASLMSPAYDRNMSGFGEGAIALMRIALDGVDRVSVARAQRALLEGATSSPWPDAERDAQVARLGALAGVTPVAPPSATIPATPEPPPPPDALRGADRETFTRAQGLFQAGAVRPAYEAARPLFSAYPKVVAIQDFRCQLAVLRWLDRGELLAECAPFKRLSGAADGGAPPR